MCLGMVPPTGYRTLLLQSTIKEMLHRHIHRPVWQRRFFNWGSLFPAGQVDKANCDIFSSSSALSLEVSLCINFYMGPVCHQEMPPDTCLLTLSVPISLELLERKALIEELPPSNRPRHTPEGHGLDCWFLQEGPAYCGQVIWGYVRKLSTDMQASQQAIFSTISRDGSKAFLYSKYVCKRLLI